MKGSIDDAIRGFARFLDASWDEVVRAAAALEHLDRADFMADWLQANWELLVEAPFRDSVQRGDVFLEPYGEGAECNDPSSRVWKLEAIPTHRVVCWPMSDSDMVDLLTGRTIRPNEGRVTFDHLMHRTISNWYEETPPFDCVLAYRGEEEILLRLDQVSFLVEASDGSGA